MRFEKENNSSINASDLIGTNIKEKKLMLKSYAGQKMKQIMKETVVEFISVVSSVYHCLLFLDPPLVMSDGVLVWPLAACLRLQVTHSLWLSPSDLAGPHCSVLPAFHQPRAQEWFI